MTDSWPMTKEELAEELPGYTSQNVKRSYQDLLSEYLERKENDD